MLKEKHNHTKYVRDYNRTNTYLSLVEKGFIKGRNINEEKAFSNADINYILKNSFNEK